MIRRTTLALAVMLLATGCASGLMPAAEPERDELAEIKSRILELQRTAAMNRVEIERLRQQVVTLESRLAGGAPPSAESRPRAAPPRPAAPVSEAAQAIYDRGYTLYHQGRYVDAEAGFRRFLQGYPATSLSDNAQYWIGESRFARADFEGALAAFREVVQRYPGGNKVADSLLKAADCLRQLGDAEGARATYDELIRRFPGSAAAAMAEERRGQLPG